MEVLLLLFKSCTSHLHKFFLTTLLLDLPPHFFVPSTFSDKDCFGCHWLHETWTIFAFQIWWFPITSFPLVTLILLSLPTLWVLNEIREKYSICLEILPTSPLVSTLLLLHSHLSFHFLFVSKWLKNLYYLF